MKILRKIAGVIVCGLVAINAVRAALLLEEHFSYPDGNLGAAGIGDTVWTAGDSPSAALRVSSTAALSYPGLMGATGSGIIYSGTTFKKRSAPFPAQSNGTVYVSFLLNVQTPPSSTKLFAWLHNAGGGTSSPGLGLFLNGYELGIAKYGSSPTATTNIGPGTHLVVARYTFQTGNDRVDLWVDPPSMGDNNNVPPPTLTTGTANQNDISALSYLVLNHGISQALWLDEVRVGTTWADVTPVEAPLPAPRPPRLTRAWLGPHGLAIEGTNSIPNTPYVVLVSTNPALPLVQWQPVSTNIAGPTGEFAWTNRVDPAMPLQFFSVFVGTELPMAPQILAQPVDLAGPVGGAVTFSVSASGTPPLWYQWFFGAAAIPGRTNATLVLSNLQSSDTGAYWA
ncbi:MAG: immunoglobulin domain-containing protein, partial [Verrucomicrobiae bacterium]|nr:immunoglobulin domain-containing protein [Verrucomicrobiae bacterium]